MESFFDIFDSIFYLGEVGFNEMFRRKVKVHNYIFFKNVFCTTKKPEKVLFVDDVGIIFVFL